VPSHPDLQTVDPTVEGLDNLWRDYRRTLAIQKLHRDAEVPDFASEPDLSQFREMGGEMEAPLSALLIVKIPGGSRVTRLAFPQFGSGLRSLPFSFHPRTLLELNGVASWYPAVLSTPWQRTDESSTSGRHSRASLRYLDIGSRKSIPLPFPAIPMMEPGSQADELFRPWTRMALLDLLIPIQNTTDLSAIPTGVPARRQRSLSDRRA
jgi:hypothetical protein